MATLSTVNVWNSCAGAAIRGDATLVTALWGGGGTKSSSKLTKLAFYKMVDQLLELVTD